LIVVTQLIPQEGKVNHNFSVGPATFTEFARPTSVTLGKSIFKEMHPTGYVNFSGELAEPVEQEESFTFAIPKPSDESWKIGSHTGELHMDYPNYTITANALVTPGEEVCEQNTNFQVTSPEESIDYLEISHIGSMNQLGQGKSSTVTWTFNKK